MGQYLRTNTEAGIFWWLESTTGSALYLGSLNFFHTACLCASLCSPELKEKHDREWLLAAWMVWGLLWCTVGKVSLRNKLPTHFAFSGNCLGERSENQLRGWQSTCKWNWEWLNPPHTLGQVFLNPASSLSASTMLGVATRGTQSPPRYFESS